ncbi:DUF1768-domain-containing protein [Hygrophoropsis aurantiaca]|uniref:DUF1768-domain-containing protein n=1 Tax=Hygrophoropsis aurantiaca TaxID=72124 RepID=A0ACB8AKJ0_9AGAM|nr:DUF1768-domain-containing protein [Hygrophoropsis aurantiaca]
MLDSRLASKVASMFGIGTPTTQRPASGPRKSRPITQYYSQPQKHGPSLQPPQTNPQGPGGGDVNYPPLTAPTTPIGASVAPFHSGTRGRILFYERGQPFYEFTNFSPHDIVYDQKRYPTSEHLFQSFKFLDANPEIAELIRNSGENPRSAFDQAHQYQSWVRSDWRQVNVEKMEATIRLKFEQHAGLKAMLLGTGDSELIEDSPKDYFWGIGADGSGRNELGKALERLRDEMRHENDPGRLPSVSHNTNRFSLQDLTSLVSGVNSPFAAQRTSIYGSPAAMAPHPAASRDKSLCDFCHQKPRYQTHRYCGRTCATQAAKICEHCRSKPKYGNHPYCSKTCAALAKKAPSP